MNAIVRFNESKIQMNLLQQDLSRYQLPSEKTEVDMKDIFEDFEELVLLAENSTTGFFYLLHEIDEDSKEIQESIDKIIGSLSQLSLAQTNTTILVSEAKFVTWAGSSKIFEYIFQQESTDRAIIEYIYAIYNETDRLDPSNIGEFRQIFAVLEELKEIVNTNTTLKSMLDTAISESYVIQFEVKEIIERVPNLLSILNQISLIDGDMRGELKEIIAEVELRIVQNFETAEINQQNILRITTLLISSLILIASVVVIYRIILLTTLLQRTNSDLILSINNLETLNKELQNFVYFISHELKAPVRKIAAFSDSLKKSLTENLSEQEIKFLEFMNQSSIRLSNLIDSLLKYTILGMHFEPAPIDLNEIVDTVILKNQDLIKSRKANIQIINQLPVIPGENKLLVQLFENIILNSIKFVETGVEPIIIIRSNDYNHRTRIEIKDNGIGIPKEKHELVFEMFERAHFNYHGTGLGLTLCKKITDLHNGTIGIESGEQGGTIFWLTFPLH